MFPSEKPTEIAWHIRSAPTSIRDDQFRTKPEPSARRVSRLSRVTTRVSSPQFAESWKRTSCRSQCRTKVMRRGMGPMEYTVRVSRIEKTMEVSCGVPAGTARTVPIDPSGSPPREPHLGRTAGIFATLFARDTAREKHADLSAARPRRCNGVSAQRGRTLRPAVLFAGFSVRGGVRAAGGKGWREGSEGPSDASGAPRDRGCGSYQHALNGPRNPSRENYSG